jgi:hypothetical protein
MDCHFMSNTVAAFRTPDSDRALPGGHTRISYRVDGEDRIEVDAFSMPN